MQRAARQFWRLLALVVAPGAVFGDTVETPGADRQVSWRAHIRPLPGSDDPRLADLSDQLTEDLGADGLVRLPGGDAGGRREAAFDDEPRVSCCAHTFSH